MQKLYCFHNSKINERVAVYVLLRRSMIQTEYSLTSAIDPVLLGVATKLTEIGYDDLNASDSEDTSSRYNVLHAIYLTEPIKTILVKEDIEVCFVSANYEESCKGLKNNGENVEDIVKWLLSLILSRPL